MSTWNPEVEFTRKLAKAQVGGGWGGLIDEIYNILEAMPNENVTVTQVKEKFGGLRFYWEGSIDGEFDLVEDICKKSYYICEECGEPGKARYGGWIKTLCNKHNEVT